MYIVLIHDRRWNEFGWEQVILDKYRLTLDNEYPGSTFWVVKEYSLSSVNLYLRKWLEESTPGLQSTYPMLEGYICSSGKHPPPQTESPREEKGGSL